jgi:hypothetical protein
MPTIGRIGSTSHFGFDRNAAGSSVYPFTTFTFTPCGITGRYGPTLANMKSAYSATPWTQNTLYLNCITQGFQKWTIPATRTYTITIAGAAGGTGQTYAGGTGSIFSFNISLTKNDFLTLIVGQMGTSGSISGYTGGSGGGGSFIYNSSNTVLAVAGGGGGAGSGSGQSAKSYNDTSGGAGITQPGTHGAGLGGTSGAGGGSGPNNGGSGGAGVNSNGIKCSSYGGEPGVSFASGFVGGNFLNYSGTATGNGVGGFGGGAGIGYHSGFELNVGGGGGYSGGGGGAHFNAGPGPSGGGGGGSYLTPSASIISQLTGNTGLGYITITAV